MNNSTHILPNQAGSASSVALDQLFVARNRRSPRPVNWLRIFAKLLAFALGCLISVALGLQDYATVHPSSGVHSVTTVYGWGPRPNP